MKKSSKISKAYWMEQMVALTLIAFALGLVLSETLRAHLFPETSRKRKLALPHHEFQQVVFQAIALPLRTFG